MDQLLAFVGAWAPVLLPGAVFAGVLLLPGFLVLWAVTARVVRALVFAPVVTVALAGAGGVVLHTLRIGWGIGSFAALSVVAALIGLAARTAATRRLPWRRSDPARVPRTAWRALLPAAAVGAAISLLAGAVQYLRPIGGADRITQVYDVVWHYDVIRHILLTGDASSLDVGLLDGTAGSHYYPAAWHSLVALTMDATGAAMPVAVNGAVFVTFALVWPLSAGVLAVRLFGPSRLVVLGTVAVAALFAAFPSHFIDFGSLYSNLFSFAIAPLCLALLVEWLDRGRWRDGRWRTGLAEAVVVIVATLVGMVFAQPNSLFTLAVVVLPLAYVLIWRLVRERTAGRRGASWVAVALFTVVWLTAWVLLHDSAALARTVNVDWPGSRTFAQATGEFLLQATENMPPQVALVALIAIGVVHCARRSGRRWIVISYGILGFLYVVDQGNGGGPHSFRDYATGFWYHDHVRLAAATVLLAAPLAGAGLRSVLTFAASQAPRWSARRGAAAVVAILLTVAVAGTTLVERPLSLRRAAFRDITVAAPGRLLDPAREAFLARVAGIVPDDETIANDPNDGSGFGYSLFSLPVLFSSLPGNWLGAATPDQQTVLNGLNTLADDPAVCPAVHRQRIGWVLALSAPAATGAPHTQVGYSAEFWRGVRVGPDTRGFKLVLSDGDMSLYRITGCR